MNVSIADLRIENVRLFESIRFSPGPGFNLLIGDNGSGKTSLLEALYLLGTGRSFTNAQIDQVIRHGQKRLRVVAGVNMGDRRRTLGIERAVGESPRVHFQGERVDGISRLAGILPCQVFYPRSDELIGGGPGVRRRFLDWGVFHVEHEFMADWRAYHRALQQRNAALRTAKRAQELSPWNHALVRSGEAIANQRRLYLQSLEADITSLACRLVRAGDVDLSLNQGWPESQSLEDALARSFDRDQRYGVTHVGPHRADLRVRLDGHDARTSASRGQQKLVVYALKLAQIAQLQRVRGNNTILLADDMASELDEQARQRVLTELARLDTQIFLTAIDQSQLMSSSLPRERAVFHVERADVRELL